MAALSTLILGAVQDMLVQRCEDLGLEPELSITVLLTASVQREAVLNFAAHYQVPDDMITIAEIIGDQIDYIESGCFGPTTKDPETLVLASRRAIVLLFMAARHEPERARTDLYISLN